jgi:50S ribosomal subunit-associated GTPase HflX
MNKVDLLSATQREALRDDETTICISAVEGTGLSTLLDRVDKLLTGDALSRVKLRVPQNEGKTLALLEAKSRIFSRRYKDGMVELEVEAPESVLRRMRAWVVEGPNSLV